MARYRLKDGVYLVTGALRGAVLDTNTGNVYSVNENAVSIINGEVENQAYWDRLVQIGIAEITEIQYTTNPLPQYQDISLQFVWFEIISDDCNESCLHCYADSMPASHRKVKGMVHLEDDFIKPKLNYQQWAELIQQSYDLGCRRCQFIGGEPFLYKEGKRSVLDLAAFAIQLGYEYVEIFTNATLLTDAKIKRIKELGIRLAVSLYSDQANVHDKITQTEGSHAKTIENLRKIKAAEIKVRVATIIMRQNQDTVNDTLILIKDIGINSHGTDPLRPKGRGDNLLVKPSAEVAIKYGYKTKPNFKATKKIVSHYSSGHSCLAGKVTITDTGDVLPCIFSRNHVVGNLLSNTLEQIILNTAIQQIWNTTKDNVLVCQDCEYRYVCFDCRPLSEAAAMGNASYLHAPYPRCTYNPYTGEWANGVWRVDDEGNAWYDRSIKDLVNSINPLNIEDFGH